MIRFIKLITILVLLHFLLLGCGESKTIVQQTEDELALRQLLDVPDHMAIPDFPDYNPPTQEKITLGRHLFYDNKLSANQTQSCSSCHVQSLAFADGKKAPEGSTGTVLARNSQGLANAVYHSTLTWANNGLLHLEEQLVIPIRADNPIELGVTDAVVDEVLARFDNDEHYVDLFKAAFPESDTGATMNKIIFAIASFCRSMISGSSAYDRFINGDKSALTEQQIKGFALFNGERFECFHCHSGINFSTSYRDFNSENTSIKFPFFNNGLYNVGGLGDYPAIDQGLSDISLKPGDRGKFRPQSLRNVALTAPYMHDGSIETLREVVEHYVAGGRNIESGPYAGDGRANPNKSGLIRAFDASDEEIDAVVAFLESLTDFEFINNPKFSNPFEE